MSRIQERCQTAQCYLIFFRRFAIGSPYPGRIGSSKQQMQRFGKPSRLCMCRGCDRVLQGSLTLTRNQSIVERREIESQRWRGPKPHARACGHELATTQDRDPRCARRRSHL